MPIFSPASPEAQTAPILKAQEDYVKQQIPNTFKSVAPKESPTQLFQDYLTTGNQEFKQASSNALNKLNEFASDANIAAKKFVANGVPGLFSSSTPATYADALQQGIASRGTAIEKDTANPAMFAAGFTGGGFEDEVQPILSKSGASNPDLPNAVRLPINNLFPSEHDSFAGVKDMPGSQAIVDAYKQKIANGEPISPAIARTESDAGGIYHVIEDGHHKIQAAIESGLKDFPVQVKNNAATQTYYHATPTKNIPSILKDGFKNDTYAWPTKEQAEQYAKSQGDDWSVLLIKSSQKLGALDPMLTDEEKMDNPDLWLLNKDNIAPQGKVSLATLFGGAAATIAAVPSVFDKLGSSTFVNSNSFNKQVPTAMQNTIFNATKTAQYANPVNLKSVLHVENKPQDPHAVRQNTDGSQDLGLFQINSKNIPDIQNKFKEQGQMFNPFNPDDSAKAAAMIFDENVKEASSILKRPLTDKEMLNAYNSPSDVVKAARENEAAKKRQDSYIASSES